MYSIMIETSWQIFLAAISLYTIVKLIYFCVNLGEPKRNDYDDNVYKTYNNEEDDYLFTDESDGTDDNLFLENTVNNVDLDYKKLTRDEEIFKSNEFFEIMNRRRSVTMFSHEDVPIDVVKNIIKTAGTAPSVGHTEPWKYILIKSMDLKLKIRKIIEGNQTIKRRYFKEHVTAAPYLILVSLKNRYEIAFKGKKKTNKKVEKANNKFGYSTPLSVGLLLAALQYAGLVSSITNLTMCNEEIRELLKRSKEETIILMVSIGYPGKDCKVPDLKRKSLSDLLDVI